MLGLSAVTSTFALAIQFACLPVLFDEISRDLGLSLFQVGAIWGAASLAGIFVSLIAGLLGDHFNMRYVLGMSCLLVGITGAARGISGSYLSLAVTVFVFGLVRAMMPINITKMIFLWFKGKRLGLANGVMAVGMGTGLMLGSAVSATILSPLLGGWRNVLFLYGAISIVISLFWFISGREPERQDADHRSTGMKQTFQVISRLVRSKALWLLAITLMLRIGSISGVTGYLPLYLRGQGWATVSADSTLAAFYAVSALSAIPLTALSDRLGSRKAILIPALLVATIAFFILPAAGGAIIWVLVVAAGIFMDAFMAITTTTLLETEGVGVAHAGTALGLVFTIAMLGGVVSPPLGNSLAGIAPGAPFVFWGSLSVAAFAVSLFIKETGQRKNDNRADKRLN